MKLKSLKWLSCVILTFVMMFTMAISVHATVEDEFNIPAEANYVSADDTVLDPGRWYLGNFSFYKYNICRYRTINGNRMRVCIAWKPADNYPWDSTLELYVYQYNRNLKQTNYLHSCQVAPDPDGYYYFVLPWISTVKGVDYNMEYYAYTDGSGNPRTMDVHVWVDVE